MNRRYWLAGILALTFVAYVPSLNNGFTNWDDPIYVHDNPLVIRPDAAAILTTPLAGNYHPLTIWSLALNYRVSGLNPASFHWLSLLLHLANTALVFLFVRRLSEGRFWAAAVTSLFFGIHPMHVESVAWIAERKDVLYAFFYFLGLIAYLRYLDRRAPVWLGAAWVAHLLSAASKPAAVVLPLTLLAIDYYRRRPLRAGLLLEKAPFFAVSIALGLLTLRAQQATGAIDPQASGPSLQKAAFAAYGVAMYVAKLIAPIGLSAIYPYPGVPGKGPGWEPYLALGLVAIALPAIAFLCRRNREILFGLAFFFINIALVLQIFTVGHSVMADRYTYVPYVGLLFAVAWPLDERPTPKTAGSAVRGIVAGGLLLLAAASVPLTWARCKVWRSSETLWSDVVAKYPRRIYAAYVNRGRYYYERAKRYDEALADFDQAIAIDPWMPQVWLDKGVVLAEQGRNDRALACFDRALTLDPNFLAASNNRGVIRLRTGDLTGAVDDFSRSIALDPGSRDAYANRALAYAMAEELDKSIADRRRAVELGPGAPDNYLHLGEIGLALLRLGRHRDAIDALGESIRLAPPPALGSLYLYRSQAWRALGERERASSDAREARRLGMEVDPAYLESLAQ